MHGGASERATENEIARRAIFPKAGLFVARV
jgi:hypothetical protein